MPHKPRNPIQLHRDGFQALVAALGPADAIRFMQRFDMGAGDYTRDRHQWLASLSFEEITREIEAPRQSHSA